MGVPRMPSSKVLINLDADSMPTSISIERSESCAGHCGECSIAQGLVKIFKDNKAKATLAGDQRRVLEYDGLISYIENALIGSEFRHE